jgi:Na+:H+ antiporter, NhaA family
VRADIAVKPAEYTWRQLAGAGSLAGIGFTMSLFIAGQAFPSATDFSAAKIAVFAASILSAVVGIALLWGAPRKELIEEARQSTGMQVSNSAGAYAESRILLDDSTHGNESRSR